MENKVKAYKICLDNGYLTIVGNRIEVDSVNGTLKIFNENNVLLFWGNLDHIIYFKVDYQQTKKIWENEAKKSEEASKVEAKEELNEFASTFKDFMKSMGIDPNRPLGRYWK